MFLVPLVYTRLPFLILYFSYSYMFPILGSKQALRVWKYQSTNYVTNSHFDVGTLALDPWVPKFFKKTKYVLMFWKF
jgi:hypothetical protein